MTKPHIDPDLAVGLNFDADDLAANRAGRMSERQKARLQGNSAALWIAAGIALVFLLLWLGLFVLLYTQMQTETDRLGVAIGNAILLVVIVLVVVFVAIERNKVLQDRHEGRVLSISGKAILDVRNFAISIENRTFRLRSEAFARFKPVEAYTLYYAPRSKTVLSAEPLDT